MITIIIVLTETWLHNEMNDNELGLLAYYSIYRCDRGSIVVNNVNVSVRGGGVLIAIKSHFNSYRVFLLDNNIKQLYVKLAIDSFILLLVQYLSHLSPILIFIIHIQILLIIY